MFVPVILWRILTILLLCVLTASHLCAEGTPVIKVKSEGTISLQVVNVPLNQVLLILAKNVPMEIKGAVPSQELLTLEFSNLSLEEALRRIMRGYNYVLVHMDEPSRPVLTVMSKTERTPYAEDAPAAAAAPSEPPAGTARPRGSVPPGIPQASLEQGQEPPRAIGRRPDIGEARPPVPDPRAVPPAAFGAPAGAPPGAGTLPPGPLVQPRTAPQIPTGESASSQQAPSAPRQETQTRQAEPTVVMTPFGFRTEEPAPAPQTPAQTQQAPVTPEPTRRFPPGVMAPSPPQ